MVGNVLEIKNLSAIIHLNWLRNERQRNVMRCGAALYTCIKCASREMVLSPLLPSSSSTLRIVAGYMVVIGITGLVWPLLHLGPNHPEFQARSVAYRIGAQTRELTLSAASVVAGIGLFRHHAWARTLALGLLMIGIIYTANAFAW